MGPLWIGIHRSTCASFCLMEIYLSKKTVCFFLSFPLLSSSFSQGDLSYLASSIASFSFFLSFSVPSFHISLIKLLLSTLSL